MVAIDAEDSELLEEQFSLVPTSDDIQLEGAISSRHGLLIAALLPDGVKLIRPGSLQPIDHCRLELFGSPLPNGLILNHLKSGDIQIIDLDLSDPPVEVIIELNPETDQPDVVHRKLNGRWTEITSAVAWVEPRFRFERSAP